MDALAFLERAEANISPLKDTEAWETALDQNHEETRPDNRMLGKVTDEVTLLA